MNPLRKTVSVGDVFLIVLDDGRYLPFQVLALAQDSALSVCGLISALSDSPESARAAMSRWREEELVARVTVPTKNILNHDGAPWPRLGSLPLLQRASLADRFWRKIRKEEVSSFSTVGVLYALANAFVGLRPWDEMAKANFYEGSLTPQGSTKAMRVFSKKTEPNQSPEPMPGLCPGAAHL